jgi:hypothetical protein
LWIERKIQKTKYFGNGETFLFTILPRMNVYKWVGTSASISSTGQELFIRADHTQIAIGGGYVYIRFVFQKISIENTKNFISVETMAF